MREIPLDDDVYEFLLRNTEFFGETPSDVLRRLLKISKHGKAIVPTTSASARSKVSGLMNDASFQLERGAVGRFLRALSWLHETEPEKFEHVLKLGGRKRRYFGKTRQEVEDSGNSVNPQPIAKSSYWVVTNTSTAMKQRLIMDVMQLLGYSEHDSQLVARSLDSR